MESDVDCDVDCWLGRSHELVVFRADGLSYGFQFNSKTPPDKHKI